MRDHHVHRRTETERAPGPDRALLRALFTDSPIELHILDPELRAAPAGPATSDAPAGGTGWTAQGLDTAEPVTRMLRQVLADGQTVLDFPHACRIPPPDGPRKVLSLSAFRLQDDTGTVTGVAVTAVDRTRLSRDQERLSLLRQAWRRIGSTLDLFRTAQEVAESAVPLLADGCTVDLLDTVVHGEAPPPGPVRKPVAVRRSATAVTRESDRVGYTVGEVWIMKPDTPYAQVLGDLRPLLLPRVRLDDPWLVHNPPWADRARRTGVHSLISVPLVARGVVLGLASFYRARHSDPFDEDDLAIASELADRAALSVDNARRYTREHTLARLLHASLVPERVPAHSAVETAHTYAPVASGSTWYNVIPLSGARVGLVMGAVSGQGLHVVAAMGRLCSALAALASLDLEPGEILARLHDLTRRLADAPAHPGGEPPEALTAGCLFATYDPVTGRCALARSAHPAPLVLSPGTEPEAIDAPSGPPLGRGEPRYPTTRLDLPPDSVLALHSSVFPAELGAALGAALAAPRASLQDSCEATVGTLFPEGPRDDALLLLARTRTLDADRTAHWTLPHDPGSPSRARRLISGQLASWRLDELAFSTELIASELVTNAVRYASGDIGLRLIRDRTLICEVADTSSTTPHLRRATDDDEGGRGLFLVAQLAQSWGTRHSGRGKTIWTEQPLPAHTG